MAFRVVVLESEISVKIKLNNLIVSKNGEDVWIPLDDISVIVLDNLATTITTRTFCQLAEEGIGLIICDQKHLPIGYYGAYDNHSRSTKVIGYQINMSDSNCSDLWRDIVKHKISNQAFAYNILCGEKEGTQKIMEYANNIAEHDKTNREGHAAKVYFNLLMGNSFSRGNDEILLNSGLDFGYAIIRSYIARLCVGYGLNTQIGLHHKNEYNRFNLVDDIMEPIRPFVDIKAYKLLENEEYFKPEHRHALINILNDKILYKNKKMFFCNMLDEYVSQIAAYIQERIDEICFPNVNNMEVENGRDEL